jgi:hypothetical protein
LKTTLHQEITGKIKKKKKKKKRRERENKQRKHGDQTNIGCDVVGSPSSVHTIPHMNNFP